MLYVLSRLFDLVVSPSTLLLLLSVAGLVLTLRRSTVWGRRLLITGIAGFVAFAVLPLSAWLLRPLEDRFPPPNPMPDRVDGIISLGGAINLELSEDRGKPALTDSAGRMTEFAMLARRYPNARLVFAGGSGSLTPGPLTEADVARAFYAGFGIDPRRVVFENRSRNTHENAVFARRLVHPHAGERWLLVTTAADLPRAVGSFRAAGWPVIAVPADYHTARHGGGWTPGLRNGLRNADWAVHEWIGLVYYRLRGWTPSLFPGPD
jgi:uncharacterized SAM-binding protein YcdF (DUF218 family)